MTWKKRAAMTWEWFQTDCAISQIAATCALLASEKKHKIMFVLAIPPLPIQSEEMHPDCIIVSCKGTPAPAKAKVEAAK